MGRQATGPTPTSWKAVALGAACVLYLLLAGAQLGLPGIHYDEAKEAGVNAVELLTGSPTTPFRDAALKVAGRRFPLMVQDYIGALNVYLALPFLAWSGIGVPNLRALSVLTGLAALVLTALLVSAWQTDPGQTPPLNSQPRREQAQPRGATVWLTWGGVAAAWLLAASPSFVFWSRQGIFVTNLMQPFCLLAVWQGARWLAHGRPTALIGAMLAAGLALYAKLLAVWVIGPWLLWLALCWIARRNGPRLTWQLAGAALLALCVPLLPILLFNWQTGGTWAALAGNAGESYYGVDNLAVWRNLPVRLTQLRQTLRGDHLWYLGGLYANPAALWLALGAIGAGVWAAPRRMAQPLLLIGAAVLLSLFTISDLFITHYALLLPFLVGAVALGLASGAAAWGGRLAVAGGIALVLVWVAGDLNASLRYHQALAQSGGLADHSDATYHLAYHLRYNGYGAPIALDWGMDAPVRFLSANTVRPIEIFGYESPAAPDGAFEARLMPFLANPDNVYLLHAPEQTVFHGRREVFLALAQAAGREATQVEVFRQRDGTPLFEVWRVAPAP